MMGKSGTREIGKRFFWQKKGDVKSHESENLNAVDDRNGELPNVTDFVPPDGGWGWIVCLTSLWANGTVFGVINTFGIIYVKMRDEYGKDDPDVSLKTAFVGSTCTGVTFLMCTMSSILSDRIGIRPTAVTGAVLSTIGLACSMFIQKLELLYLTYGLILGLGSSMVYSPSLVILGHYFKKHMGLVNGIVAFGSSLFTICLTRILPLLLESIGIKYCFLFLSGLHCMLILFTLTWKPMYQHDRHLVSLTLSTESVYQHCEDCCTWTKRFLNVKIWKNRAYVIYIVSLGVALFGYFVPFFHLPKYTADNFPGADGSLLILSLSITSGVSRILCGKIADTQWVSRIKMQQLAFLVLGISTACIPFASKFGALIGISLLMGVCDGVFVCLLGPIAFDIVGPAEASQAIGFLLGIFSIPFTVGPPLAGWMYDYFGDYRIAFHIAGVPPILGAIIMFLIPKLDQSYPAVTEAMEFASVSNIDVFKDVTVSASASSLRHQVLMKAPAKSGPATEMQVLTSQELLVFSKPHKDTKVKDTKVTGHMEEEATPMLQGHQKVTETHTIEDSSLQAHISVGTSIKADDQNAFAVDDALLNKIEEQMEAKKVLFDSEEKTTI
ncbi:monocarboxylate transporter 10-like [Dreissena polymorpha]|uniref:Monocarboxylate transporter 10 n=1 Tax=Dreissena polymorpha TaxID=45954 RepID=A0A9D4CKX9_DREPO|nr:monocarboxylate transporter 10-like [Dreissena polymorpha]KAH3726081.1 hypothetical protein DPMN_051937 [Dreissena polymorpha]